MVYSVLFDRTLAAMFYLALGPVLALLFDYAGQNIPSKRIWMNIIVGILTVPSLLIWVFQYNYSRPLHWQIAVTLVIFSIFVSIFIRMEKQFKVKILTAIASSVGIACYAFFSLAMVAFLVGEPRTGVRTGAAYKNYIAYVTDESLYSHTDILIVYKRRLSGIIEKQVAYIALSDNPEACECFFSEGSQQLKYDRCKDILSSK